MQQQERKSFQITETGDDFISGETGLADTAAKCAAVSAFAVNTYIFLQC